PLRLFLLAQKNLRIANLTVCHYSFAIPPSVALRAMEGIFRALRSTPLVFAGAKKSADSKPYGLPSAALAKDGGSRRT
ncbi:MAG: hypothetical protein IKA65_09105, partial [Lentisphaeria bacterium]|nr:hypothetical protein [Lentisphaeria bacterium]